MKWIVREADPVYVAITRTIIRSVVKSGYAAVNARGSWTRSAVGSLSALISLAIVVSMVVVVPSTATFRTINLTVVDPVVESTQKKPSKFHTPMGISGTPGTASTVQKFPILTSPSAWVRSMFNSASVPATGSLVSVRRYDCTVIDAPAFSAVRALTDINVRIVVETALIEKTELLAGFADPEVFIFLPTMNPSVIHEPPTRVIVSGLAF